MVSSRSASSCSPEKSSHATQPVRARARDRLRMPSAAQGRVLAHLPADGTATTQANPLGGGQWTISAAFQNFTALIGLLAVALAIPAGCSDSFHRLRSVAHVSVLKAGNPAPTAAVKQATQAPAAAPAPAQTQAARGAARGGPRRNRTATPAAKPVKAAWLARVQTPSPQRSSRSRRRTATKTVERDIAITATFSEPIDERSVTTTSCRVDGSGGRACQATLSVNGNVVSFTPSRKLLAARRLCIDGER